MSESRRERFRRWRWNHEGLMIIGGALGAFVALIVVVCTLIFTGERLSCSSKGDRVGLTATYKVFSGCWYTLPDGREVPDDRYPPKYIEVGGQLK